MPLRVLTAQEARQTVLRRRGLADQALPPAVAQRIREVFGADLSPQKVVQRIIAQVRSEGDAALRELTARLDGVSLERLEVPKEEIASARVAPELERALELAAQRIAAFHTQHRPQSWLDDSASLGQLVRPLARVGIYVPGGRASYPSTVLMTAIPAKVAGVSEVVVSSPPGRDGRVSAGVLVAARLAQVDRVFAVGGAQAIAALAYGTESVPAVDKILGPGNIFVTLAKREVFGVVGIDQLAGPTETVVVADGTANPQWVAADLLAQAEHDPLATAILITTSRPLAKDVDEALEQQLPQLPTEAVARAALEANGAAIVVDSIEEALELANAYAPEHLCLLVADPWAYLGKVRHAGGVFLGEHSPEVLGDYLAGPSHVMPTAGSARFASPLTIHDFLKITSLVALSQEDARKLAEAAALIAEAEGLPAHARAARLRMLRP